MLIKQLSHCVCKCDCATWRRLSFTQIKYVLSRKSWGHVSDRIWFHSVSAHKQVNLSSVTLVSTLTFAQLYHLTPGRLSPTPYSFAMLLSAYCYLWRINRNLYFGWIVYKLGCSACHFAAHTKLSSKLVNKHLVVTGILSLPHFHILSCATKAGSWFT